MKHKTKLNLTVFLFVPLTIITITAIVLFFPIELLSGFRFLTLLPLIFLFILLFKRNTWQPLISDERKPWPFLTWVFTVIVIELLMGFLFLSQTYFLYNQFYLPEVNMPLQFQPIQFLGAPILLTFLIVVAATQGYRLKQSALFSPFRSMLGKTIVATYLRLSFRFLMAMVVIMLSGYLAGLFVPSIQLLNPFFSFVIVTTLIFFMMQPAIMKLIQAANHKPLMLGALLFLLLIMLTGLLLISHGIFIYWLLPRIKLIGQFSPLFFLKGIVSTQLLWSLLCWSLWLLMAPFFASIIARLSVGRRPVTLMIVSLLLPVTLIFINQFVAINWAGIMIWLVPFGILSLFIFLLLFFRSSSTLVSYYGYLPMSQTAKLHYSDIKQVWLFVACLMGLLALSGLSVLILLSLFLTLPLLLIAIFNSDFAS